MSKPKKLPKKYFEALGWIAMNDDCAWLDFDLECGPTPSVTLCLVADLFGVDQDDAIAHLRRVRNAIDTLAGIKIAKGELP